MAYKIFTIPIQDDASGTDDLNHFLRSHRILRVTPSLVDAGCDSVWSFLVEYRDLQPSSAAPTGSKSKARIDYREVLSPEDFSVFSRLRDWRRDVSQRESIPAYTVFDNEQLATMVTSKANTRAAIAAIPGVGEARVEKYADSVLAILAAVRSAPS